MSIAKKIVKNTAFLATAEIIHKILFFFLLIYATRTLGAVDFGRFSFALAFGTLAALLVNLGIPTFFTREVARNKDYQKHIGSLVSLHMLLMFITLILTTIILTLIGYKAEYFLVIMIASLSLFLDSISTLLHSIFKAHEKMEYIAYTKVLQVILIFSLGFWFLISFESKLILFTSSFLIASFVGLLMTIIIVITKFIKFKLSINYSFWKKILKQSLPFTLAMVFGVIYFKTDTIMLQWLQGDASVGYYNAAFQIVGALLFIPGIFCITIFPLLAAHYRSNTERFDRIIRLSFKYLSSLAMPIALGLTLTAARIIMFLYDKEFLPSTPALQLLAWTGALIFMNYLFSNILIAMNKEKQQWKIQGYAMVFNIIMNLILIPLYDISGAAIATIATQLIIMILFIQIIRKDEHYIGIISSLRPALACSVMGIFVIWQADMHLLFVIPIAALVYTVIFLLLKGLTKEDINLVKEVLSK